MRLFLFLLTLSSHHLPPLLALPPPPAPCRFPAIFNFGDSNSDTGGLSAAFATIGRPYGETFFRRPAGRYSDGRLIVDFAAESLGLPHVGAYLDSVAANFSHGANFATALSTVLPQSRSMAYGGYSPFSLDVQVRQFLQFLIRSQVVYKQGGVFGNLMPRKDVFSRALYMFDIGQNDLTAIYSGNRSAKAYLSKALEEFSNAVKSVYEVGGRSFWIHNTGPLGCLPYVLVQLRQPAARVDSTGCSILFNELVAEFNRMLNQTVTQLRVDLPRASLVLTDIYAVKYSLIQRAAKHGFERPLEACCGHGGGAYNYDDDARCGHSVEVNGTRVLVGRACRDPSRRVNWDGPHYTEAANKWVFDQIKGGAFSSPLTPLTMVCHQRRE